MARRIILDGVSYTSVSAAARALGVARNTILSRLQPPCSDFSLTVDGQTYTSRRHAAEALGIAYPTFCSRVAAGWSEERLVQSRSFQRRDRPVTVQGQDFPTVTEMLNHFRIDQAGYHALKRDLGLTDDDAVSVMLNRKAA